VNCGTASEQCSRHARRGSAARRSLASASPRAVTNYDRPSRKSRKRSCQPVAKAHALRSRRQPGANATAIKMSPLLSHGRRGTRLARSTRDEDVDPPSPRPVAGRDETPHGLREHCASRTLVVWLAVAWSLARPSAASASLHGTGGPARRSLTWRRRHNPTARASWRGLTRSLATMAPLRWSAVPALHRERDEHRAALRHPQREFMRSSCTG